MPHSYSHLGPDFAWVSIVWEPTDWLPNAVETRLEVITTMAELRHSISFSSLSSSLSSVRDRFLPTKVLAATIVDILESSEPIE
jgi:hypothetical protein